jgi:hypothetical protein
MKMNKNWRNFRLEDVENIDEQSKASKEAEEQGLVHLGFGRYGPKKGDSATHVSMGGALKKVSDKKKSKKLDDKPQMGPGQPSGDKPQMGLKPFKAKATKIGGGTGVDADFLGEPPEGSREPDDVDYDMGEVPGSRAPNQDIEPGDPDMRTGDESSQELSVMIKDQREYIEGMIERGEDREDIEAAEGNLEDMKRDRFLRQNKEDDKGTKEIKKGDKVRAEKQGIEDGEVEKIKQTERGTEYVIRWNNGNNLIQLPADMVSGEEDEPWRYGPFDVVKDKDGEDMFVEPDKKPKKKRPGGKEAEDAYHKADMMMKKYAGRDIEKAEYWAKKKRQAASAMMGRTGTELGENWMKEIMKVSNIKSV